MADILPARQITPAGAERGVGPASRQRDAELARQKAYYAAERRTTAPKPTSGDRPVSALRPISTMQKVRSMLGGRR